MENEAVEIEVDLSDNPRKSSSSSSSSSSSEAVEKVERSSLSSSDIAEKYERSGSIVAIEDQVTFSWDDLTVTTTPKRKKIRITKAQRAAPPTSKTILNNARGIVKPGELLAIMGASGAGKSTLLNALTFRNLSQLNVSGNRFVNGVAVTNPSALTAVSAYIQQDDIFIGTLTPKEHLYFQARVRIEGDVSKSQRKHRAEEIIGELGLTKCKNTVIGQSGRIKGISGGEMKRLALASEVLTNPALLFCDEPTSGLDAYMAQKIVEILRSLAEQGKTIVCTIHQPSSQVFAMFDKVLLMAEGKVAYMGPLGDAYNFFGNIGFPCPDKFNPADHYVHVLAVTKDEEEVCRQRIDAICRQFDEAPEGRELAAALDYEKTHKKTVAKMMIEKKSPYRVSWSAQFKALLWRSFRAIIKEPMVVRVTIAQTIFFALLLGIVYFDQEYDQTGAFNINGALFIMVTNMTFGYIFPVLQVFCLELPIFLREHFNGAYRVDTYFITKQMAELPFNLTYPLIFISIYYWMIGLNPDVGRFFMAALIVEILVQTVVSYGYLISCLAKDINMALAIAPPLMIPFLIFGGFFVNSESLPGWLAWIEYISWWKYTYEALMINQWTGVTLTCPNTTQTVPIKVPDPLNVTCPAFFPPPVASQVCDDGFFVHDFNETVTINATVPVPCTFATGEDVLDFVGLDEDNLIFDIFMLILLMAVFRVGAYFALYFRTKRHK